MTKTTSFQMDIRPLFTERDIQGMSKAFNLGSYDDVKKHSGAIYDRIRGIGGAVMPPPHHQKEKVLGRNLGLNYSPSGWRTGSNLSRPPSAQGCFWACNWRAGASRGL
jgi:hypothetical protein